MRWLVFAISAYLMLVLEVGLRGLLQVNHVSPSWLLILMVFVALWAQPMEIAWAALVLGLVQDLLRQLPETGALAADVPILGPWTLGYLVGAFAVWQLRGLIFRESVIAMPIMVVLAGFFAHISAVALLVARDLLIESLPQWHAADELLRDFGQIAYTAVLGLPLGLLLHRIHTWWGFHSTKTPQSGRARRLS